jgi:hypothetical protein
MFGPLCDRRTQYISLTRPSAPCPSLADRPCLPRPSFSPAETRRPAREFDGERPFRTSAEIALPQASKSRLCVRCARDHTGTRAGICSSQRLPAELAARPTCAGRPRGAASQDASLAAPEQQPLTTRRRSMRALWLEPALHPMRNQRLLSELRAPLSRLFGSRGRCATRGRTHGRMAVSRVMPMRRVGGVG